jgi:hypothetical protein
MNRRLWPAALFIVASTLVAPAAAQSPAPRGNTGGSPRDRSNEDKYRSNEIERVRREARKSKAAAPEASASFPLIKEDFERIQIINNDVLQDGGLLRPSGDSSPNYVRVSEAASEIQKRAARLKSNLFPADGAKPPPENEKKPGARGDDGQRDPTEPGDLKSLLAALDEAINGFAHNPIFTNLQVVDVQHSAKARQDLERVVRLSALLKKEAERMKKTSEARP